MRVGELSSRTGIPVPTIKYYLREGLLPAGELTCPNQAQYGEPHIRRLKLVRALVDVGGLSIAAARQVLGALDSPDVPLHTTLGVARRAAGPPAPAGPCRSGPSWQRAVDEADEWLRQRGWRVDPNGPARASLAQLLLTLRELGQDDLLGMLDEYAAAAERLAAAELALVGRQPDPDGRLQAAVLGTVLGDTLLVTLRRLAQEDACRREFAV
ncbi:MerR family transcriptional regulator [Kitasatospora sp. NPDC052896]|uniref:MerR family transcriptional regulator n=1 Tax=Kitasatospora sp. NPDC052896 TaxID=3364061 RepID=UPI0037C9C51F